MPRRASASHISFDLAGPGVFGQRLAECATAVLKVAEACLPRPRCLWSIISSSLVSALFIQSLIIRPLIGFLLRPNLNHRDLFSITLQR